MTNILTELEERKRKASLLQNLMLNFEAIAKLAPQIFNKNMQGSSNFMEASESLTTIMTETVSILEELKAETELLSAEFLANKKEEME